MTQKEFIPKKYLTPIPLKEGENAHNAEIYNKLVKNANLRKEKKEIEKIRQKITPYSVMLIGFDAPYLSLMNTSSPHIDSLFQNRSLSLPFLEQESKFEIKSRPFEDSNLIDKLPKIDTTYL